MRVVTANYIIPHSHDADRVRVEARRQLGSDLLGVMDAGKMYAVKYTTQERRKQEGQAIWIEGEIRMTIAEVRR